MNPGRELDALIAERVMGWQLFKEDGAYWQQTVPEGQKISQPPLYSTSISSAWEVVEKLQGNLHFSIDGEWVSQLSGEKSWKCRFKPFLDAPYVWGKTAPHAICLAALKAVGVEVEAKA